MIVRRLVGLAAGALTLASILPSSTAAQAQPPLSFDRYKDEIEGIFIAPRGGHGPSRSPCATCHVESGTPLKLQPLQTRPDGTVFWTEEQSRQNFEIVSRLVVPGQPERSRLLLKALAVQAGGAPFHVGGKFFQAQNDSEWQRMAAWVRDAAPDPSRPTPTPPTLDFEFFQTCVQQVFQSKRPGRMECVHCHGGGGNNFAREIEGGRAFWNLEESRQNFEVLRRYIEPGYPLMSRFLTHPLSPEGGGDPYHGGGRRWMTQDDPEWMMLAAWVRGESPACRVG